MLALAAGPRLAVPSSGPSPVDVGLLNIWDAGQGERDARGGAEGDDAHLAQRPGGRVVRPSVEKHACPLAGYVLDAAAPSSVARFGGVTEDREWIFPSRLPGHPISATTLGDRLRAIGVEPGAARNTALVQLALQQPPGVLGRLIGVRVRTATRWIAAIAASQARYATSRAQDLRPSP